MSDGRHTEQRCWAQQCVQNVSPEAGTPTSPARQEGEPARLSVLARALQHGPLHYGGAPTFSQGANSNRTGRGGPAASLQPRPGRLSRGPLQRLESALNTRHPTSSPPALHPTVVEGQQTQRRPLHASENETQSLRDVSSLLREAPRLQWPHPIPPSAPAGVLSAWPLSYSARHPGDFQVSRTDERAAE